MFPPYRPARVVGEQTLAARFLLGPLPLPLALNWATGIAAALRDLHLAGQAHGGVNPSSIVVRQSGAVLQEPETSLVPADPAADVAAFGALLFEMLTGAKPAPGAAVADSVPPRTGLRTSPASLYAGAVRVAAKCLALAPDERPGMVKVAAELRLLSMLAKHSRTAPSRPKQRPAPPAAFQQDSAPAEAPGDIAPPDGLPEHRKCPECGSANVHLSRAQSRLEKAAAAFRVPLYRCHKCYHRWFLISRIALPCKIHEVAKRSF